MAYRKMAFEEISGQKSRRPREMREPPEIRVYGEIALFGNHVDPAKCELWGDAPFAEIRLGPGNRVRL